MAYFTVAPKEEVHSEKSSLEEPDDDRIKCVDKPEWSSENNALLVQYLLFLAVLVCLGCHCRVA